MCESRNKSVSRPEHGNTWLGVFRSSKEGINCTARVKINAAAAGGRARAALPVPGANPGLSITR